MVTTMALQCLRPLTRVPTYRLLIMSAFVPEPRPSVLARHRVAEHRSRDFDAADRDYREELRIASR